jgi:protein pelota|tara:strand:+ start:991 stop:2049 length:1059 start_codon:yes stop_codon:yes gene_type:complete
VRQIKKLDEGVRLRIESEDDLWVLAQLCRPQSVLGMLSHRRDSTTGTQEDGRAKSAERKPMWIVLNVEKTEFQAFTDNLRAHGIIKEANFDVGLHHTHIISPGDEIELSFSGGLAKTDSALLKETIQNGYRAKSGLIVVENDEIILFEVTSHGIRDVSQFSMRGGGKRTSDSTSVRKGFFQKVATETALVFSDSMPLVICGPGLAREQFSSSLREVGAKNQILNVATSIGGRPAANEVLAEGLADSFLGEHALVSQIKTIEEGLKRISTNGAVAYGLKIILQAADAGAIETLAIDANLLRSSDSEARTSWESISEKVVTSRGRIIQVSQDHDSAQQLMGLGGALALLRWKID